LAEDGRCKRLKLLMTLLSPGLYSTTFVGCQGPSETERVGHGKRARMRYE